MIYIYTETFCWWPRLKYYVKVLLGRQNRGPKAVEDSLMRGLTHLGQEFSVNQKISEPIEVACVLSGAATLRKIIAKKRSGQVKYIIAGPVISVLPGEHNGLMASPEMDVIIVPSGWVKNLWISQNPSLAGKIQVWPAGVRDLGEHRDVAGAALVFQKNAPEPLLAGVLGSLDQAKISFKILRYGHFSQAEYFQALAECKFLLYLSQSESQGLALQEAWMSGLPTLVWNCGYWTYRGQKWEDTAISAPLMSIECGLFFKDITDFSGVLQSFVADYKNFNSRQYALEHFTDEILVGKYLKIIQNLNAHPKSL